MSSPGSANAPRAGSGPPPPTVTVPDGPSLDRCAWPPYQYTAWKLRGRSSGQRGRGARHTLPALTAMPVLLPPRVIAPPLLAMPRSSVIVRLPALPAPECSPRDRALRAAPRGSAARAGGGRLRGRRPRARHAPCGGGAQSLRPCTAPGGRCGRRAGGPRGRGGLHRGRPRRCASAHSHPPRSRREAPSLPPAPARDRPASLRGRAGRPRGGPHPRRGGGRGGPRGDRRRSPSGGHGSGRAAGRRPLRPHARQPGFSHRRRVRGCGRRLCASASGGAPHVPHRPPHRRADGDPRARCRARSGRGRLRPRRRGPVGGA